MKPVGELFLNDLLQCADFIKTCKNCEKSRRTCAGYQIPQIRTPSVSDPYFVPQPHPSPPFDGPHSAMDHMATRYASTTVPTPEYAHQLTPDEYSTTYVPTTQPQAYGYPIVDANVSTTYTPYPPSHNWQPPPIHASQAYAYNTHHPFSFDVRTTDYSAYPGRQAPKPPKTEAS